MSGEVIGLDVGTSSVKGLALAEDGEVVAAAEEGYPLSTPKPGWSEQDPEGWWDATDKVLAALPDGPAAIGLSGQMHGLVALDGADRPVRAALLWNDQRTGAEAEEVEERLGGLSGTVEATANRSLTGLTAPKLLWLERNEPEAFARVRSVMLPKDYVRLRLCGERATDVCDASGTGWFDVGARAWSSRAVEALGVDASWLPSALECAEESGRTADGVPVAAGAGDQGAGAVGVGIEGPGPASVVLGTSGVVLGALEDFAAEPEGRVQVCCSGVPGAWFAMGVVLSAAGSLRWLRETLDAPYDALLEEAERWPPGCDGLTFLPYLTGERTPVFDPDARGAFTGLEIRHDRGALVRAVLEGVAHALRDALDLVVGLGGEISIGRVSGGGARSDLWLRILASALELPLERVAVDEGAAYGAALLGGVAGGVWADVGEAVGAAVRTRDPIEPDPAWVEAYAEARVRYRSVYPALSATASRGLSQSER